MSDKIISSQKDKVIKILDEGTQRSNGSKSKGEESN